MGRLNYRALARIERKARVRSERIARYIVRQISLRAPYDSRATTDTTGPHLKDSYYTQIDPATGDVLVLCKRRYWVFVEYGTKEHGEPQPHVRPALAAARAQFGIR